MPKLLTAEKQQEFKTGFKQPKPVQPAALESLVATVQRAIMQMSTTNAKAMELLDGIVLKEPSVQVRVPEIVVPEVVVPKVEVPQIVMPEPDNWKRIKATVTRRDKRGFIEEVILERAE